MKRWSLFLFFVAIFTVSGCSSSSPTSAISKYLEDLDAEEAFSGVVLIAKDGEPIFGKAYGIANRADDVPNRIDTKFNIGSMNKMFTAVAILQLVEQGKLSVNDKIIEHITGYPNQELAEVVTIHQLLTHTSGMGDFFTQEYREASKDRFMELDDYLPLFVDHPLQFEPGTRSNYSNAGYIVLGIIIEEITGETYFDYIDENIYQKCGMTESGSYESDRVVQNIAIGYAGNLRNYGDWSSNMFWLPYKGSSAGGGYSTAGDMLLFSNCLLNHQLLSPEQTENLLEARSELRGPIPGRAVNYAYGFVVKMVHDHLVIGHSGGLPGACSNLDIFIDHGYTAVVLSNSSHDCVGVRAKIGDVLLN